MLETTENKTKQKTLTPQPGSLECCLQVILKGCDSINEPATYDE